MYWKCGPGPCEMRSSIAVRLATLFALVAFAGFALISVTLYWVLERELFRHQREQIQSRMDDMHYSLLHVRAPDIAGRIIAKIEALTPEDGRNRYWLGSNAPEFRYGQDLDQVLAVTQGRHDLVDWHKADRHMRLLAEDLPASSDRPAVTLIVGTDYAPFGRTLHSFQVALMAVTAVGTLIVALAGFMVARLGLLPVGRMSREAHRIEPGNSAQRLNLATLPAELADLGGSLNAALDRLDAAYLQLETFNGNVAHELRTPLANLIGQTQVALSRERGEGQLREVMLSNLEELERLRTIVADMLFLARAEQGARATGRVETRLAREVAKTLEFMEVLLDEACVSVSVHGDATVPVQVALLHRALTNLLQNAIQHADVGSQILVRIDDDSRQIRVTIANRGTLIPPQHLPHLFDRFYRIDVSRVNSDESHGLGLAIVKAVALMHQGGVFASSRDGLTQVGFSIGRDPSRVPVTDDHP